MGGSRLERRVVQRETRYARSGVVSIAYQVVGDGPTDLILVPGFVSHVEVAWEEPRLAHFLGRLASFSRLIVFDKRGTGMSDPVVGPPSMDQRMDDIRAVMDAAGSRRATIFGISEGGTLSLLFLVMGALTDAPDLMLNLVATVVSTVLSNELHRRFTFRTTGRGSVARGQSAGSGMAVIGLLVNSLALANGTFWFPMPGA